MTPDQEQAMRSMLADYSKMEYIDLAISLQETCDNHVHEKRGLQGSVDAMALQLPALRAELEQYESGDAVGSEEVEDLRSEILDLKARVGDLQLLNEGLQKKLIG